MSSASRSPFVSSGTATATGHPGLRQAPLSGAGTASSWHGGLESQGQAVASPFMRAFERELVGALSAPWRLEKLFPLSHPSPPCDYSHVEGHVHQAPGGWPGRAGPPHNLGNRAHLQLLERRGRLPRLWH